MKVLCITDKAGRIQYNRMQLLSQYMPFDKFDVADLKCKAKMTRYDLVYYSHFSLYDKRPCDNKQLKLASVTSHKCLLDKMTAIDNLKRFDGISVNNPYLFDAFEPYISNLHYTPNGVDTGFFHFRPKQMSSPLVVGWVGNRDRLVKNFCIFEKLRKRHSQFVDFRCVAPSKSDKKESLKSPEQMREFYYHLDYFLVTSTAEGTPNPALESMACGVPCIATKVGNMEEIIDDSINGFLVDKVDVTDFKDAIWYANNIRDYPAMRQRVKAKMTQWDWSIKSKAWVDFFKAYDRS